jgi:hypothetical protein
LLERQGLSSPYTMLEDSRTLRLPRTPVAISLIHPSMQHIWKAIHEQCLL